MTHFKVEIQLPLYYNPENGKREKIPDELFYKTYIELFDMVGGIHTSPETIFGAWRHPDTGEKFYDDLIAFNILIATDDKATITNIPKIKEIINYKKILKDRFKQHEIFMVATRCIWL